MNTNRIINTDPLEDIDNDDDLLFTNAFVSQIPREDITHTQKQNFRRYYEDKKKKQENKKIIQLVEEDDIYQDYSKFQKKKEEEKDTKVIQKIANNTIKTEKVSIISVDSSTRNKYKYPFQNDFELDFRQSFYNIKSIRLLSTTIPNTDQVIRDTPEAIRTDKISWQNLEDLYLGIYENVTASTVEPDTVDLTVVDHGLSTQEYIEPLSVWISNSTTVPSIDGQWVVTVVDSQTLRFQFDGGIASGLVKVDTGFPTYTVYITPGNYNLDTLAVEIQRVMNLVRRRKGTGDFHYFTIDISNDTDVVTIRSYIITPLELNSISTQLDSSDITVNSEQHGFKDGDFVLMTGLTVTGGLSSAILNGLFVVKNTTRSTFQYEVSEKATFSVDGGGNSAKTGKPTEFRFLFDTAQTKIVEHIGYPDEDSGVYMNTTTETPLSIYTKTPTDAQIVGNYIEFTSVAHQLEENTVYSIQNITLGTQPTVYLSSVHNLTGKQMVFIYYTYSSPNLNGFYHITINGANSFYLDDITTTSIQEISYSDVIINIANYEEYSTSSSFGLWAFIKVSSLFIAVGSSGSILTSRDTVTWDEQIIATDSLFFVVWSPELQLFVTVGDVGSIATSPDAIIWTIRTSPSVNSWSTVEWSSDLSLFVALANDGGASRIITSPDGITWTEGTLPVVGTWYWVIWVSDLGLFIGVSYDASSYIITSPDGITWTSRTNSGSYLVSVVWSSQLNLLVAVGYGSIETSPDGVTWTSRVAPSVKDWWHVIWSSELGVFFASDYFGAAVMSSDDGITWTETTTPFSGTFVWNIWDSELNRFSILNRDTPSTVFHITSPFEGQMKAHGDNIRLLQFKSIPQINEREFPVESVTDDTFRIEVHEGIQSIQLDVIQDTVIQTNKLYVNHPLHGFNELTGISVLPFLEATWTKSLGTVDDGRTMYSIIRGNGLFISVGRYRSGSTDYYRIRRSVDGSNWTSSYFFNRFTQGQLNSVCYAHSVTALGNTPLYVAVGEGNPSNNLVLISDNPITDPALPNPAPWNIVNVSFGGVWESVCWSPQLQLFVACGYVSTTQNIMTSPDGSTWTLRTNPSGLYNESYTSVTWSPELGIFVAVGYDYTIYSSDGINWSLVNNYPDDYWESVTWSPELGLFVAVASELSSTIQSQYVMTSTNGLDWIQRDTPSDSYFKSVTWAPELGIFLAVGGGAGDSVISSTFQAGSSTPGTLILNATESTDDDFYNEWNIEITSGVGDDNQIRRIKDYVGATRTATIYVTADNVGGFTAGLDLVAAPAPGDSYTLTPSNSNSMMTSRNGITWVARSYSPPSFLREVCWASDLDIFVSTSVNYNISPNDYRFLISNITYSDIQCTTLVPHTYTGTRYNDADLDVYIVIVDNADIDIPDHGLQTNDEIIITDSTTTPNIDGTYFVEVVDSDTVRIPVTLVAPGTCKVRHGDSIIFTGTNSIPKIDGIEATVIGYDLNDPLYLEIAIGINVTTPGTWGIIGRRNIVSMHRVEASEPYGDNFAGIPLEIINNTYHQITKLIDENNYIVKLNKYANYTFSGGGSGITISSERNGTRVFQSNTFTFEETGALFKAISLDGEKYLFLISPKLQSVISPGNEEIGDIFAKILLMDSPGNMIFNSFISAPKVFNPPLGSLSSIQLTMKRKDGYLFNFHNTDYSLSLEITEIVDQIRETGLSGRTGASDIYRNEALRLT